MTAVVRATYGTEEVKSIIVVLFFLLFFSCSFYFEGTLYRLGMFLFSDRVYLFCFLLCGRFA